MTVHYSMERRYPGRDQIVYYVTLERDSEASTVTSRTGLGENYLKPLVSDFVGYLNLLKNNDSIRSIHQVPMPLVEKLISDYAGRGNGYFMYLVPDPARVQNDLVVRNVLPGFLDYMSMKATLMYRRYLDGTSMPAFISSSLVVYDEKSPTGIVKFLEGSTGGKISVIDADGSIAEIDLPRVKLTSNGSTITAAKKVAAVSQQASVKFAQIEKEMVDRLNRSIKEVKESAFVSMFRDVRAITDAGWELKSISSPTGGMSVGEYFYYDGIIHPVAVSLRQSAITDRVIDEAVSISVPLPKTTTDRMSVSQIYIPVGSMINGSYAFGYYPHKDGDSYDRVGSLCIGDLLGQPITNIIQLLHNLTIVNFHSMYGGNASDHIHKLVNGWRKKFDETGVLPMDKKRGRATSMFRVGTEFSGDSDGAVAEAEVDEGEGDW